VKSASIWDKKGSVGEVSLKIAFGFLVLYVSAIFAWSAPEGVRLRGNVVDEDGKPVAGLEIRIQSPDQQVFVTQSDAAGLFAYSASVAGNYRFSCNKSGFFRVTAQAFELKEGLNQISFTVNHETEIHEKVEVYSTDESIQPLVTSHQETLIAREIRDIPVSSTHDLRNSLEVLPEVVRDNSGQLHIAGGRTAETQYLLDGFDIGDPVTGNFSARVNVDSVRSAQVESGRYSSQYGNAGAGVLTMDTAVGDDQWRAGATNFLPGVSLEQGIHLSSWYPRLTLSGPIHKDRAWFSEALSIQRTFSLVQNLPSNANSITQWAGDNMLRTQIKLTPKNMLQGSFLYNQLNASHIGLSPFSPISTTQKLRLYRSFVSLKDQMWSGRTFYEIGIAVDSSHTESRPQGSEPYELTPNGSSGNYFEARHQDTRRWQALGSMSKPSRHWHGTHDLQFGFNASEIEWNQVSRRSSIEVIRADGTVAQQTEFFGPAQFNLSDALAGAYAHDVWHVVRPLVLQFGIKTEWDRVTQRITPSPRISANILPFKSDRAKLSVAWGIFVQPLTLSSLGPAYDEQRSDLFYQLPPKPLLIGPVISRFQLPDDGLRQPRFYTMSLGWEEAIGGNSHVGFDVTQRNGRLGLAYEQFAHNNNENIFLLQNNRRDRYRSVQFSFRHSFSDQASISANYTRSGTRSNRVFDYSLQTIVFTPQQSGPLNWDAPNRFISSGWAPAPLWGLFLSYFFEYRTGFPFSIVNEQQQVVGQANQTRFPDYLSLNIGIEKRVHLFTKKWAVRLTILNVTSRSNPDSVINNVDSPDFMKFAGGSKRALSARVRLVG